MIKGSNVSSRHWKIKDKALKLRKKGLSYHEIRESIPVAKSTLSLWCRYINLTPEQKKRLQDKKNANGLMGIQAIQKMFWGKRCEAFMNGVNLFNKIGQTPNSNFIAGIMLYWAEGSKSKCVASIANSDPRIIKFMVKWFGDFFEITPKNLKIYLHLHSGQNEQAIKNYWTKLTGVTDFGKSFTKPEGSGYRKNTLYNGTVKLTVKKTGSTYLLFKILGAINAFLNSTISEPIKPEDWMPMLPYAKI